MTDYISRDTAKEFFLNMDAGSRCPCSTVLTPEEFAEYLDEIPAADVEPVRRGRWCEPKGGFWRMAKCSLCGEWQPTAGIIPKYCPNCGAKMKGDEND